MSITCPFPITTVSTISPTQPTGCHHDSCLGKRYLVTKGRAPVVRRPRFQTNGMGLYIASTVFRASLPILLNTSFHSARAYLRSKPKVPVSVLRERVIKLDLRSKVELYQNVLQDVRDSTVRTDMMVVAMDNVQELLVKINDLLTALEVNLGLVEGGSNSNFFYVSRRWYDRNDEEMVQELVVYDEILTSRFDSLVAIIGLQLQVREAHGANANVVVPSVYNDFPCAPTSQSVKL